MPIARARTALGQVFFQRCFYLFVGVLALITAALLLEPTPRGRMLITLMNLLMDVTAVAAIGRTLVSFVLACVLAIPAMAFTVRAIDGASPADLLVAWSFSAALYGLTIALLMRYVFRRDVMTADKLYGAAAGYLMLGVLWAYLYAIAGYLQPGSFVTGGEPTSPPIGDLLYFSFTTLTSTGFGDFTPLLRGARTLCVLEQLTGALFLAILIARLAGVYPQRQGSREG